MLQQKRSRHSMATKGQYGRSGVTIGSEPSLEAGVNLLLSSPMGIYNALPTRCYYLLACDERTFRRRNERRGQRGQS